MDDILKEHYREALEMFGLSNKTKTNIRKAFKKVKQDHDKLESSIVKWINYLHNQQKEIVKRLELIEQKLSSTK